MGQNGYFAGGTTAAPRRTFGPVTGGARTTPKAETTATAISKAGAREIDGTGDYGQGARTIRVAKNKDVVIAGNPYDFFYANHDGWLFRYKILHKGGGKSSVLCFRAISLHSRPACSRAPSIQ